jgi:hypothetical protein
MSSSGIVRWGGLAAMLGGTLGIVLAPILTYLLTTSSGAYLIFGKGYFLVYLGCLAGLMGLNAQRMRSPRRPNMERLGLRVTFVGLATSLVGDILAYWGDIFGGELLAEGEFTAVQSGGVIVEVLGLLLLLVGSVILGVTYLRANVLPRLLAWLLILAGPGGVLLSFALHFPSGTMLLFCVAWVVLGYTLWSGRSAAAEHPSHVN